jgi:hypothetical protein
LSIAQAVDYLREQQARGFSYFHIFQGQLENFAPVVAQLANG